MGLTKDIQGSGTAISLLGTSEPSLLTFESREVEMAVAVSRDVWVLFGKHWLVCPHAGLAGFSAHAWHLGEEASQVTGGLPCGGHS